MHTPLCGHAYGEPTEYAAEAVAKGFGSIVFTCHSPMPKGFWPRVRMGMDDLPAYRKMVEQARSSYEGRLRVGIGIESDWFPGYESWLEDLHGQLDGEHVLGSVHFFSPEYQAKFGVPKTDDFFRNYFDHLVESAQTGLFDTLAHPDLVKNHSPDDWQFERLSDHISKALDAIAKTGVGMELNTSGVNKRLPEMNPGGDMLMLMAEKGIPLVLGSDAHVADRVGNGFREALDLAEASGYREVSMMWRRARTPMKIEDVREALQNLAHV